MESKQVLVTLIALVLLGSTFFLKQNAGSSSFLTQDEALRTSYEIWKLKYNKKYGSSENEHRFNIYKMNYERIQNHNSQDHTFELGENQFMDLSFDEFLSTFAGYQAMPNLKH